MQLETLYKRTSTGKIQYWKLSVEIFGEHQAPIIVKESGQLGTTSPVLHRENVYTGKQGRNANQQAEAQAQSDWKRKHDEGYKSIEDLGIEEIGVGKPEEKTAYYYNSTPYSTLSECLDLALPQFNTDAAGELLPQLAKSKLWTPGSTKYPAIYEDKFDGNRTTIVLELDRTFALSRTGKPQKNLDHLIAILDTKFPPADRAERVILDGEVYLHGLLLEEINEAIKKANENTPKLQFMMYDLPLLNKDQEDRSKMVQIASQAINSPFFPFSITKLVYSDSEVLAALDDSLERGLEGGMVKNLNAPYQPGQRSSDWKKVKIWDDTEFKVVGYKFGQRGIQDLNFVCICDGGEFEVNMKGTLAQKQSMELKLDSYIGRMLTVQHKGYTKYGIPNLAKGKLFRDE